MRTESKVNQHSSNRRGAVAVESAVVLSVFILILFGLLDLGLATLNSNNLKDTAQQLTRAAIVRGQNAAPQLSVWGPTTYAGTAAGGDEIASQVAKSLIIMPASQVNVLVEWPDGGIADGNRVRATLTYTHQMIAPAVFGFSSIPLKAVSTLEIVD